MKRKKPKATPEELLGEGQRHTERGDLAEAEACYRKVLAADPDHPPALCLLGLTLVDRENFTGAIDVLERARAIAPEFAPVQLALGSAYSAAGHDALAVNAMESALRLEDTSPIPLERLAKHHLRMGRTREAIGFLRRALRRDPSHAQAKYLLAGLTGDKSPEVTARPPADLIAELFDAYATTFEEHLTTGLQYDVPRALTSLVAACCAPPDASWTVLDLGCGTGLVGVEVRPYARTLIGADISPRILARARQRGIYDELHREDLLATLARVRDADLIVAADVFIYVGVLEATFAACAAALRPGGLLAFSTERSDTDDVVLLTTLRYAHAPGYIARLAAEHGFTVERVEPSVLRVEKEQPVHGELYVLRRRESA
ncbi:MAG: tetratricopeptide repeat protein [Deltaproteobacteria bacterium]|nr:tetratricopeptide repeat protein [Deltaproteobacteria bacterium]